MNSITRRIKNWTPTKPRKKPDNIVSSNYTTAKTFIPSYEKEKQPRIEQLLTNDYQRIWWKEKQIWDETFANKIASKRILRRMLIKRKIPTCVTIEYPVTKEQKLKVKKTKKIKQKPNEISKVEKMKFVEIKDTKSKKCEETKLGEPEEIKSQRLEETKSEILEETKSQRLEETKSEILEETKSQRFEEAKSNKLEKTKSQQLKETVKLEETKSNLDETNSERYEIRSEKSEKNEKKNIRKK